MRYSVSRGAALLALFLSINCLADDFWRLDPAYPNDIDAYSIAPVFDFDGDGCLPSAGISRWGQQNGGLKPSGSIAGGCRNSDFLESSNTLHRHACKWQNDSNYCVHFYALYFLKDQVSDYFGGGHRHDWEHVAIWTINGQVSHGSYSAHGDLYTQPANELAFENGHLKIVYHKDGVLTHAFRFSSSNEWAENPYGVFVTPPLVSWYVVVGDWVSNQDMRALLNTFDYGSASIPLKDSNFINNVNTARPAGFPAF